ncbi:MAG: PqqD family peptide modification chaperone [Candidatus Lokiarchaeia archaeon]
MKGTLDEAVNSRSLMNQSSALTTAKPWLIPDVLFWKDKDDYLISNPKEPHPMKLNIMTFFILKCCNGKNSLLQILDLITKKFQVEREVAEKDLLGIIELLVERNFVSLRIPGGIQRRKKQKIFSLQYVSIALTNQCNLKCFMCYANSGEHVENELNFMDWSKVLDSVTKMGAHSLILTGGEPLVYEDFIPLIRYAKNLGLEIDLCTNGSLITEETADLFKKEQIRSVRISLDGGDAKTHDKIRGKTGAFKKTIRGIKLLKEQNIRTEIQTVVLQNNFNDIAKIAELSTSLGVYKIEFSPIEKVGRAEGLSEELFLSAEQMRELHEFMLGHQTRYKKQLRTLIKKRPKRFVNPETCFAYPRCGVGIFLIHIDPVGAIYPCSLLSTSQFRLGNILSDDLKKVWNKSEILGTFRKKLLEDYKECQNCGLRYTCLGGCRARAYYLNNDLLGPDPFYCIYYEPYKSID